MHCKDCTSPAVSELCLNVTATDLVSLLTECKHAIPRSGWASSIQNKVGKSSMCWFNSMIALGHSAVPVQ